MKYYYISYAWSKGFGGINYQSTVGLLNLKTIREDIIKKAKDESVVILGFFEISREQFNIGV